MDADEIRRAFLDYMTERGHTVIPRAPLIPKDDPTTLFTGSGMQPLLPYLLGADHPEGPRLADSQTCLRAQDIEEVGDSRHTTFFEMLGSWSLGDYFKDVQITQFWTFLTEKVGLDPSTDLRLLLHRRPGARHPQGHRVGGASGPGCSPRPASPPTRSTSAREENGVAARHRRRPHRLLRQEELVVPRRDGRGHAGGRAGRPRHRGLLPVPRRRARPGLRAALPPELRLRPVPRDRQLRVHGVPPDRDRVRAAAPPQRRLRRRPGAHRRRRRWTAATCSASGCSGRSSRRLEELSGKRYEDETRAMRVIADHLRGATFLAVDGVRPSNKAQGYVMRRLIRRATRFAFDLGLEENFFPRDRPDHRRASTPTTSPRSPSTPTPSWPCSPRRSRRSAGRCARASSSSTATGDTGVTGAELFVLYDTFGFPVELSTEEAQRKGIALSESWRAEFDEQMAAQRARSQGAGAARS